MPKQPLSLPRGSVRALVTLVLVVISAAMVFVPVADGAGDVKTMFVLLTGIAVRDYFAQRAAKDAKEEDLPDPYYSGQDERG